MRRIAVTGAMSPLGRCVRAVLEARADVERVCGIESRPARERIADRGVEIVSYVPDHRPLVAYLEKEGIDTVVQCDLAPDRTGLSSSAREADVIATLCMGAAIGQPGSLVQNWVLVSSSAVYPVGSHSALIQREKAPRPAEDQRLAASVAEAEDYARDMALRHPYLNVAILRLQHLIGPGVRGPLAELLASNPTPALIGFDPAIQLLHLEDAARAIAFATSRELAGVYNVASSGLIRWLEALRVTEHARFPVLPIAASPLEPFLRGLRVPFVPSDRLDLLRFGHAIDTRKIERAGWRPEYDQRRCLMPLRASVSPSRKESK